MKLNEAIEVVLKQFNHPMTAREIADEINSKQLYVRGDKNPVPPSQIHARINNYPEKFIKANNKIDLFKNHQNVFRNFRSKKPIELEESLDNLTKKIFNEYHLAETEIVIFICALCIVIERIELETDMEYLPIPIKQEIFLNEVQQLISEKNQLSEVYEILLKNKQILTKDFFNEISFNICYLIDQSTDAELKICLLKYLDQVGVFGKKKFMTQFYTPDFLNKLLVELADPKDNEIVLDPASGMGKTLVEITKMNNNVRIKGQELAYNSYLLNKVYFYLNNFTNYELFCSDSLKNPKIEKTSVDLIISDIPFGKKYIGEDFSFSLSQIKRSYSSEELFLEFMLSRLNEQGRILTVIPQSLLVNKSTYRLRQKLIDQDILEAVISLPKETYLPYFGVETSIIVINKNKIAERTKKVLFIDIRSSFDILVKNNEINLDKNRFNEVLVKLLAIYKSKSNTNSSLVHCLTDAKAIISQVYDLSPARYLTGILDIIGETSKKGELMELSVVLERYSSYSKNIDGKEIKYVQIKDLHDGSSDFYLDPHKLISYNNSSSKYRIINSSALLLARVGNKIKPTYFEYEGQLIGINPNILAYTVKKEIVNIDYLITQLKSDFFKRQFEIIISGAGLPSFNPSALLKLKIPIPPLFEQLNRLAIYKEQQSNNLRLTQFIHDIRIVSSNEEIKAEIERFAQKTLQESHYIAYKREFEFEKFPFTAKDLEETRYIKRSQDAQYFNLLLLDDKKEFNGVLIIQSENDISFEQYSEINAYANFILRTSSKYIQENTNRLLNDFSHTTKNILKDINKILSDFLNTPNQEFLSSMKTSLLKDEEMISYFIRTENKKREDFLAFNRLEEARNIVNKHFELFKRRHEYYTKSINANIEEIKLSDFLERLPIKKTRIKLVNEGHKDITLLIKSAPIELAFSDIINNATNYSADNQVDLDIFLRDRYIEFKIANNISNTFSKENYEILGKEDIKNPDGTYSTGLSQAFRCINEENDITLASYENYKTYKRFEITIKLKKK